MNRRRATLLWLVLIFLGFIFTSTLTAYNLKTNLLCSIDGRAQQRMLPEHKGYADEVVRFDYARYPAFRNIQISRGEYAWKAGIINETAGRYPGVILWMDCKERVSSAFLHSVVGRIKVHGYYNPTSTGFMKEYTPPGMYAYFNAPATCYAHVKNSNGAFISYNTRKGNHHEQAHPVTA
ncbi:hypothetical protein K493DRAFT_301658 [Basidiobolus meristosporus CBS 931.73]|uniref:Uncharacterized protein n=1 Tax=Basidiobolus meristosporus CBS 931.73 TaxID=1314790 RepID=A0A1Y1YAX9_9FUNG|nr:hypothetical protein K493DRAFT_301658 [Basidiobolus meristosporus CBS 931.73]|eukprot:ORX95123.1 hypothetical protein K493DRAFT_301658 [Basidiobolus meristosporus CBS 931.73]